MMEVVCGFRSAISSDFTVIRRPWESAKTSVPLGRLLQEDAAEDGAIVLRHGPGDELGRDFPARRDDRLDQPAAVGGGCQGREIRPDAAATAVNLVAAIATRPLGVEEDALAGRRVGRPFQAGEPVFRSVGAGALRSVVAVGSAFSRSIRASDASSPWLEPAKSRDLLIRGSDAPQGPERLVFKRGRSRPSPAPGAGHADRSHPRPVRRSPRRGSARGHSRPRRPRPAIANRPGCGPCDRLRTASSRTAWSGESRNRFEEAEHQRGVVGPEHPQPATDHRGRGPGVLQERDDVVLAGQLIARIIPPDVEPIQGCQRALEQLPCRRGRGQARQQLRAVARPAGARRPTGWPRTGSMDRGRPGTSAAARDPRADPSRGGSGGGRAAGWGRGPGNRRSRPAPSVPSDFRKPSRAACCMNGSSDSSALSKRSLADGSARRRIASARTRGEASLAAIPFRSSRSAASARPLSGCRRTCS